MRLFQGSSHCIAFIVCLSALSVCVSAARYEGHRPYSFDSELELYNAWKDFDRNVQNSEGKGGNALFDAVENNDLNTLQSFTNLNYQNELGRTALLLATIKGHDKIAEVLMDNNADLNKPDLDKNTPLIWAAWKNHERIVEMLVNKGARLNQRGNGGMTALISALQKENDKIAKLLIDKGADLGIPDEFGRTPLIKAAWHNREQIVRLLLEKGANKKLRDTDGYTALDWAEKKGHQNIVKLLEDDKLIQFAHPGRRIPLRSPRIDIPSIYSS